jgi:hypothetical protein
MEEGPYEVYALEGGFSVVVREHGEKNRQTEARKRMIVSERGLGLLEGG